jgi:small subunit ribosomal protein S6
LNNYELTVILNPNLSEGDVEKIGRELSALLTSHGATTIFNIRTERRALAYSIRKYREGTYLFIDFQAPPTLPEKVRRDLLHREEILRLAFFRLPELKTNETQAASVPPGKGEKKNE